MCIEGAILRISTCVCVRYRCVSEELRVEGYIVYFFSVHCTCVHRGACTCIK